MKQQLQLMQKSAILSNLASSLCELTHYMILELLFLNLPCYVFKWAKPDELVSARVERLELPTPGFGDQCSTN